MTNNNHTPADGLKPCPKGCQSHPQHMYLEPCRDIASPNWNKMQSRIWCPSCKLTLIVCRDDTDGSCVEDAIALWNTRPTPPTSHVAGGLRAYAECEAAAAMLSDDSSTKDTDAQYDALALLQKHGFQHGHELLSPWLAKFRTKALAQPAPEAMGEVISGLPDLKALRMKEVYDSLIGPLHDYYAAKSMGYEEARTHAEAHIHEVTAAIMEALAQPSLGEDTLNYLKELSISEGWLSDNASEEQREAIRLINRALAAHGGVKPAAERTAQDEELFEKHFKQFVIKRLSSLAQSSGEHNWKDQLDRQSMVVAVTLALRDAIQATPTTPPDAQAEEVRRPWDAFEGYEVRENKQGQLCLYLRDFNVVVAVFDKAATVDARQIQEALTTGPRGQGGRFTCPVCGESKPIGVKTINGSCRRCKSMEG